MSLVEKLLSIRTGVCASVQALGGKCLCSNNATPTVANCVEDLNVMKIELLYLTGGVSESVPPPPSLSPREKKRVRSRSRSPLPTKNFGIFIRYMHSGIGDDEEVYNVGHLEKDRELEKRRLCETIFGYYGKICVEYTKVWEGIDNAYQSKVPFACVYFADEKGRKLALNDADNIEKKYRLRIVANKPYNRKE
jgi:hypothetical protein